MSQSSLKPEMVDSLIWFHFNNRNADPESSIQNLKLISNDTHKESYYWGEMKSLQLVGEIYQMLGNRDSCIHYLRRSMALSQEREDTNQTAIGHSILARLDQQLGHYPAAIQAFDTTLSLYKQIKDTANVAWTLYDMSWVYMLSDDLDSAMMYAISSTQYAEAIRDTQLMGGSYNTIGTIHKKLGNYEKSETFYLKCINMYEGVSHYEHLLTGVHNNIGLLYQSQNKIEQSLKYYDKMEAIASKYQDDTALMTVWINKGSLYNDVKKYTEAQQILIDAVALAEKLNMSIQLADASDNLANTYIGQRRFEMAVPLIYKAITLALAAGSWETEMKAQETAKKYCQKIEDADCAIKAMERIIVLKDSLFQSDMARQVNVLQQQYESAKQEATISRLDAERAELRSKQRLIKFGLLSLFLLAGVLFYGYYQYNQKERLQLDTEKRIAIDDKKRAQAELNKKSKELTTNILQLAERNKQLQSYRAELIHISKLSNKEPKALTERLVRRVDSAIDDNTVWTRLTEEFKVVHSDFLNSIGPAGVSYSKAELRLIVLLKMNLSSKEIAQILHISGEGVKKARQRLRKKLELHSDQNLQEYILNN